MSLVWVATLAKIFSFSTEWSVKPTPKLKTKTVATYCEMSGVAMERTSMASWSKARLYYAMAMK